MWNKKKKWYTITDRVDIETGECLTKSDIERGHWVKVGREQQTDYSNENYNLNKITIHYERSKQTRLWD